MDRKWKRTYLVFMAFYVFDFVSTLLFCKNPDEEGGPIPYFFMKLTNSVLGGLVLNILVSAVFWAVFLLRVIPYSLKYIKPNRQRKVEAFEFIWLGIFSSLDFAGATSWYLQVPIFWRFVTGLVLFMLALVWIRPFAH